MQLVHHKNYYSESPIVTERKVCCSLSVAKKSTSFAIRDRESMAALRILIADDHSEVRTLLRNILESVPHWQVCGEAENGTSAVTLAGRLHPDVVVMDLAMPEVNGLEAARQMLSHHQETRIVLTTLHEFPAFVDEARRAGACGCFFKTESGKHLIPAVRVAVQGKEFFTPDDFGIDRIRLKNATSQ
jgi:DNA-binding NarL/FixJ family response regulator